MNESFWGLEAMTNKLHGLGLGVKCSTIYSHLLVIINSVGFVGGA